MEVEKQLCCHKSSLEEKYDFQKISHFFLASSSGVPGVLHGCCLSGMLGVIKLFLDGCLALLATGVLGVLRLVLGVFTLRCVGVFRGVFWDDLVLDGVFVAGLPAANIICSQAVNAMLPVVQRKKQVWSVVRRRGLQNAAEHGLVWVKHYRVSRQYPTQKFTVPFSPCGGGWNQPAPIYIPGGSQSCDSPEQNAISLARAWQVFWYHLCCCYL